MAGMIVLSRYSSICIGSICTAGTYVPQLAKVATREQKELSSGQFLRISKLFFRLGNYPIG